MYKRLAIVILALSVLIGYLLLMEEGSASQSTASSPSAFSVPMSGSVLVAGATGLSGLLIVKRLQQAGAKVRVLVRNQTTAQAKFGSNVEYSVGDVTNPDSLKEAVKGVDGVICTTGATNLFFGSGIPFEIDYKGVRNLVDAVSQADKAGTTTQIGSQQGTPFVLVSSVSVTKAVSFLAIIGRMAHWKLMGENHLRSSGLPYAVVRPSALFNSAGGTRPYELGQGDHFWGGRRTDRDDLALTCVNSLHVLLKRGALKHITFEMATAGSSSDQEYVVPTTANVQSFESVFAKLKQDA